MELTSLAFCWYVVVPTFLQNCLECTSTNVLDISTENLLQTEAEPNQTLARNYLCTQIYCML